MSSQISNAAVLGAGTMGRGIAHVAAVSGIKVVLFDINAAAVERGREHIRATLDKGVTKGKLSSDERSQALENLTISTNLEEAVASTQLVVEAAPEKLELKQSLFQQMDLFAPQDAILGTNTSSLSITEIAKVCSHPERVLGMHFFNPPHILRLLELVKTDKTTEAALNKAKAIGEQLDRELIVINDSPGFATSRLGLIIGLEAMRMLQEEVGSASDIDRAMELGYRHPMGPLRLTDLVGLDVRLDIAQYLHQALGGDRFEPPEILKKMVEEGKLGKKSGQGFYKWD
tara:strand:- start:695 stop:1555 length:861 start_codon:yes stop_codon:yes gene_type:complete